MARSIATIKNEITTNFIGNPIIAQRYGLDPSLTFDEQISKTSLENLLFYVVSTGIWVLENIFERHRTEINTIIDDVKPHSLRWYVNKTKAFRKGQQLLTDSDQYNDIAPTAIPYTDEQIEQMQVVKYAAANELTGVVYIKIAGGDAGSLKPVSDHEYNAVSEYLAQVKDAGVRLVLLNSPADIMRVNLTLYYNPMMLNSAGVSLATGGRPVEERIRQYVAALPFNGEHRNVALVDALQQVEGVVIPELNLVTTRFEAESDFKAVETKEIPYSGYYKFDEQGSQITYIAYESISN